ncbi:hypothetical protein GGC63_003349 [Paenibacillus sp. OAS669]|nr:hypothetical protein [Paenibacillus sp. OAS669]
MTEEFEIDYGARRPLTFRHYVIDSEVKEWFLDAVGQYVAGHINIETVIKMDRAQFYRLVEKSAILLCRIYSPTAKYGITKAEVRSAVVYWIRSISEGTQCGEREQYRCDGD